MCRSTAQGGQRCAAHTRPRYDAATFGTEEWDIAAAEYASTPEGRSTLMASYEGERSPERSVALYGALSRGANMRAAHMEIAETVRDANTPHISSEDGTNHVYWNRQGTGWITTHSLTNARRDAARSSTHAVTLEVAARMTTGSRERPVTAALVGSVTVSHNGVGQGFTVTDRDLKCNCADYQATYDCEHVRQAVAEMNQRINQERVGQRHTGTILQSEFDQIMAAQASASPVDLGAAEVEYADDFEAWDAEVRAAAARRAAGEPVFDYAREDATGGLGSPDGGRGFGIELEYEGGDSSAIGRELFEAGLTPSAGQRPYHSDSTVHMNHQGGWKFEQDCTVDGEVISPIMYDTPETWENLEKVCDIIRRNGGTASVRAGSHIHVSSGNFGSSAEPYGRLIGMFNENEDLMYRLASNPETQQHRLRGGNSWCNPNPVATAGYTAVSDLWRSGHANHSVAVNLGAVQGNPGDNVEFRMWDSTLDPSVIQAQIVTSLAMTESAYRDSDYTPGPRRRVGAALAQSRAAVDANPDRAQRAETAGVRSFVDRIVRRTADKRRIATLFAITRWQ